MVVAGFAIAPGFVVAVGIDDCGGADDLGAEEEGAFGFASTFGQGNSRARLGIRHLLRFTDPLAGLECINVTPTNTVAMATLRFRVNLIRLLSVPVVIGLKPTC
jgi:hypothetical protein